LFYCVTMLRRDPFDKDVIHPNSCDVSFTNVRSPVLQAQAGHAGGL
jgi:hypothetical protein